MDGPLWPEAPGQELWILPFAQQEAPEETNSIRVVSLPRFILQCLKVRRRREERRKAGEPLVGATTVII